MRWSLLFPLLLLIVGCSETLPETIPELSELTFGARDEARAAREDQNPDDAAEAADRAADTVSKLNEIVNASENIDDEDRALLERANSAAHEALFFAQLADEEQQRANKLDSWKASGYAAMRSVGLKATFSVLSLAARQAAKYDLESLPETVRESAEFAAVLASLLSERPRLPDDWEGIARDMDLLAESPTMKLTMYLSLAFLMSGQVDFALFEIETVKGDQLSDEQELYGHILRSFIYSYQDWRHLSVMEVKKVGPEEAEDAAQLLAMVHLARAQIFTREREYELGEQELIRAARVWPNNPVLVFLTGEHLAATGEYKKAAESLESLTVDIDHPIAQRMVNRIAERARDLRDGEPGQSLLNDHSFMTEMAFYGLVIAAEQSEAADKVRQYMESARLFGERIMDHLPGIDIIGASEEQVPEPLDLVSQRLH
jgi:hypothetical protein